MYYRRDFLKYLAGLTVAFSLDPAYLFANDGKIKHKRVRELPRHSRIFCLFDNPALEAEIEKLGLEVVWGEPFSPDILVLGGFVDIIDRNLAGKEMWKEYVDCCNEFGWDEPCLIVDNIQDLEFPKTKVVAQFDLSDPSSVFQIKNVISEFDFLLRKRRAGLK